MVSFRQFFTSQETLETTHFWVLSSPLPDVVLEQLVKHLAHSIVEYRCRSAIHFYEAWKDHVEHGVVPTDSTQRALEAFLKPVFGDTVQRDHLEGYVGEMLWYFLYQELPCEGDIVRIEPPGFKSTDPGGDSLVIYRLSVGYLRFRLWEMKKSSGDTGGVSNAISNAYDQLNTKAMEYLARYTAIAQETDDPEVTELCGQLLDLWDQASHQASVGVAVSTSVSHLPSQVFTTFGQRFPQFTSPIRLKGMLTAVDDFTAFAERVRSYVWTGL